RDGAVRIGKEFLKVFDVQKHGRLGISVRDMEYRPPWAERGSGRGQNMADWLRSSEQFQRL
ncbi:MAG: hypothetical protein AAGK57_09785, partial [Pseudomonadota bacterium]